MIDFIKDILLYKIETPTNYGAFHIGALIVMVLFTVFLCSFYKEDDKKYRAMIGTFGFVLILLEVYKLTMFAINIDEYNNVTWDFTWYAFPFQFCSSPLYVYPLVGLLPDGKVRNALKVYLSTYMLVAGISVMAYPDTCFISTLGIDIQTMMVHGSMVAFGLHSLITGKVKFTVRNLISGVIVFTCFVLTALVLDVTFYQFNTTDTFNMYFISPYYHCTLPVLSTIEDHVPYIIFLFIYILSFSLGAFLILLTTKIGRKKEPAMEE